MNPNTIADGNWSGHNRHKRIKKGRIAIEIKWPQSLYDQIRDEALLRQWSFSRMVRHLCEASIEGIE